MSAQLIGLGIGLIPDVLEKIAQGWGGGDMKDLLGEQAGMYADQLMERKREGMKYLPKEKAAMFAQKFPEAMEWLDLAMETDEGISFLILFLRSVQAKLDDPKNNQIKAPPALPRP